MYVTPKQKQRYLITTLIIAIAIPITAFAAYLVTQIISNAGGSTDPDGVVISNVASNSLTLTWVTDAATTGSVVVTTGGKDSAPFTDPRGSNKRFTHYIEVTSLEPNKDYTFYIMSDSTKYTSVNGKAFKFKTPPITTNTPVPNPVYGSISGSKDDDVLVYIVTGAQKDYPASTTPNKSGNWIIDLSSIRDGTTNLVATEKTSPLRILVRAKGGTGAIVKGKYNELFDKDGKLFDSNPLTLNPAANIIANFSTKSVISSVIAQNPDPVACKCPDGTDLGNMIPSACETAKASQCTTPSNDVSCLCPDGTDLGKMSAASCTTAKATQCTSAPTTISCECDDGTNLGQMTQAACTTAKAAQCKVDNGGSNGNNGGFNPADRVFRYILNVNWMPIAGTAINGNGGTTVLDVVVDQSSVLNTNLTDTAFTVVWLTKIAEQGYVKYGKSLEDMTSIAYDDRDDLTSKGSYQAHSVKVSQLTPDTTYYYAIYSGERVLQDNGQPYTIKTLKTLASPPQFKTVSGKVTGIPTSKDAVIYSSIKDGDSAGSPGLSTTTSSIPDDNGNWIITVGDMRTSDGADYYNYSSADSITFKALVYADIAPATQTMATVDSATITLSPKAAQVTDRQIVKVSPLTSSGVSSTTIVSSNSSNQTKFIPKTAIYWPAVVSVVVGSVIIGGAIYMTSANRVKKAKRMSNSIF